MAKLKLDTAIGSNNILYENSLASYQEIGGSNNATLRYLTVSSNGSVVWQDVQQSASISYLSIQPPYYSITPNVVTLSRSENVSFAINSAQSNTVLYWSLKDWSNTLQDSDFSNPLNAVSAGGSVSINNGTGNFKITASPTANAGSFQIELRANSTSGPIANVAPTVSIASTDYIINSNVAGVLESGTILMSVSTTQIDTGTLYWTLENISGSIQNIDFTSPSNAVSNGGSVAISNGSGSFTLSVSSDGAMEDYDVFRVLLRTGSTSGTIVATSPTITVVDPPANSVSYTSAGTYSWTCPENVYSVCVVCIGGGGGGAAAGGYSFGEPRGVSSYGGGGAGLGWKNNVAVTPGSSYTVVVGAGGTAGATVTNPPGMNAGGNGGDSYFISLQTVKGGGGRGGGIGGQGGTYLGDGGGNGGSSISNSSLNGGGASGGGGAGGYAGDGGSSYYARGSAGTGGGAGAGTGQGFQYDTVAVATGYGGGGVGIQGQGSNGTYVIGSYVYTYSGFGGSGGTNGIGKVGGTYGGGAGGESASYNFPPSGQAGQGGAVRILWGQGRHFPSTNTSTSYDKNLIVPTIPASPTYTLSRSASSVEERNSITITLTTTNTVDGTVIPYSITGINASDLSSGSTTGNFVITNNVGTITIAIAEDFTTEGTETATLELESPGIGSISWTINDSSITYALSRDKTTIAEEETITITLTTQGLPNGNTVPYTITGISSSDLTSGTLTGNFTINNNSATQTFTAVSDASTEGTETAVLTLDGLAQSISWTITDPFIIPNLYDATFFAGLRSVLSSNLSIFKNTGFYEYVLDGNSTFISDGANDMYDSGNYTQLFENGTQLVNPIDYSTATNTTSGNIRYASLGYARPLSVIAVTQQGVSRRFGFGKTGNLGADGGGTTDTLDMGGSYLSYSYSAWARRVYNAGDPSICDLYMTIYSPTKLNSSYGGVNISDYSTSTDNGYSRYETTSSNSIVIAMLLSKPSGSAVTSSEATTVIQNVISVINSYIG